MKALSYITFYTVKGGINRMGYLRRLCRKAGGRQDTQDIRKDLSRQWRYLQRHSLRLVPAGVKHSGALKTLGNTRLSPTAMLLSFIFADTDTLLTETRQKTGRYLRIIPA